MKKIILIILFFSPLFLFSQTNGVQFENAENQLKNKEYKACLESYIKEFKKETGSGQNYYDASICAAKNNNINLSFNYLEKAIKSKHIYLNSIVTNKDLEILHTDKRWLSILKKIKKAYKEFTQTPLTQEQQKELIDYVNQSIAAVYFDKEKGNDLQKILLNTDFGNLPPKVIVKKIKKKLVSEANDIHFHVGVQKLSLKTELEKTPLEKVNHNGGFSEVRFLKGNIGYIKWDRCIADEIAYSKLVAALIFLKDCDALIFDITNNPGGNGAISGFIFTHLFKSKKHQTLLQKKCKGETEWRTSEVPFNYTNGPKFYDTPVYIMTSKNTGSAAEYFAFTLQELKRGKVIGQTTAGAGNPVLKILFGNYFAYVPNCEIRTKDGKSIEAKGVVPDIEMEDEYTIDDVLKVIKK
ncbi:Peptidase family S41 [Tenacibaculum sp. MAR_2009_124]|uniref:S41 family peptidase n=1 Tax=Tenacibaculum sp. MAR_2009_124 TaxID=1250059 RepID=UPI00089B62A7|nr:S41 family peptidase [Tenacibaculum sp. MAR_2009_124]SEC79341.1 Peptidase family S41 [Tenacibaculum sp. MAR_2009_124]